MAGNAIGPQPPPADGTPAAAAAAFDPFDPRVHEDLYEHLRWLREHAPVHYQTGMRAILVSRYDDVACVFADRRFTKKGPRDFLIGQYGEVGQRTLNRSLFFLDPPDHTRLRELINRPLMTRAIERLRPHTQQVVGELVDAAAERGELDLVDDFAFRMLMPVIAGPLFAVPDADCPLLEQWGLALFLSIGAQDPKLRQGGEDALVEVHDYFTAHVKARHGADDDTLLDALLAGVDAGQLSLEEVVQLCMQLTSNGGYDTTSNLIASGLWLLLRDRAAYDQLAADRSLMANTVEEICRFETPGQLLFRDAAQDVTLPSGGKIPAGALVGALPGAANRDPTIFPDPDRLVLGRQNARQHLGFGTDIHYCVGAPVARLVTGVAWRMVLDRLPNLTLLEDRPRWRHTFVTRGHQQLPAAVGRPG